MRVAFGPLRLKSDLVALMFSNKVHYKILKENETLNDRLSNCSDKKLVLINPSASRTNRRAEFGY